MMFIEQAAIAIHAANIGGFWARAEATCYPDVEVSAAAAVELADTLCTEIGHDISITDGMCLRCLKSEADRAKARKVKP